MRRRIPWWPITGIILVIIGIAGYNIWAYNCGYCAIEDMKTIGPQAKAVGYLVLGAAACWFVLFFRRARRETSQNCQCGCNTVKNWSFCPECGLPTGTTSPLA